MVENLATAPSRGAIPLYKLKQTLRCVYWPDKNWGIYNSSLDAYERTFKHVLNGSTIEDLVSHKQDPVVIDIMAPAGTLAELFAHIPSRNKLGIAVGLEDIRTSEQKLRDNELGITSVKGDITKSSTWKEIESALDGKKVDLIIERAVGGLNQLPRHAVFYGITLQRMWHMLSDDGILLLQLPSNLDLRVARVSPSLWVKALAEYGIEARYNPEYSALFVKKSSFSPAHLPFPSEAMQPEPYDPYLNKGHQIKNTPTRSADLSKICFSKDLDTNKLPIFEKNNSYKRVNYSYDHFKNMNFNKKTSQADI